MASDKAWVDPDARTDGSMKRGISLLEVIIVLAIILLIAAILFPVLVRSREAAKVATCTSNLRQAYIAWSLYVESSDGLPPERLEQFVDDRSEFLVMTCPSDTFSPGANKRASQATGQKISYIYPPSQPEFWTDLQVADSNHGILACVVHGESEGDRPPESAQLDTTGLVLRLRRDGSVQRARVGHVCVSSPAGGVASTRSEWTLFTDEWPCPEPYCPAGSYRCP